jgi:hypothetical protein
VRWLALALAALALCGCETTAEKSAKLEKAAKQREDAGGQTAALARRGVSVTRESEKVKVLATAVLHSTEGDAAVVMLHNSSATTLRDVPIEITVRDARGAVIYTNNIPGLAAALASVPLAPAHASTTWIDDQLQASGIPASVSAKVGEGSAVAGEIPQLSIQGAHLFDDPTSGQGAEGEVVNHSAVDQEDLVVYALARRRGRIVAAGRAVLPSAPANASTRFQAYFVGDSTGAQLTVGVLPSTIG